MTKLVTAILAAIYSLYKGVATIVTFFKEKKWRKIGRQEQQLEDSKHINELHNKADEIDARPPMSRDEQLEWLRKQNKSD